VGRRKVAVVGAGVAGLTAAYVLQRDADVALYESEPRLGGHADTHDVEASDGRLLAIDTGFIVHNRRTYPTLLRLFDELGITTQESDMSMSISCAGCGLCYAGGARAVRTAAVGAHGGAHEVPAHAHRGGALPPPRQSAARTR
jgi:predicted NAD/FAD-binding protein